MHDFVDEEFLHARPRLYKREAKEKKRSQFHLCNICVPIFYANYTWVSKREISHVCYLR